ncbi:MAG: DUF3349 domain-containing protein [Nocardioides sp.]
MSRAIGVVRVVGWVHRAYPNGIDEEDRGPLATILGSHLSGDQVVELLGGTVPRGDYRDDLPRVSSKLAAAGWPLADPALSEDEAGPIARTLAGVVSWLRAGYPEGVPENDYIPLVAILERRLTKREVRAVRRELEASGTLKPGPEDIGDAITTVINEPPTQADIERVTAHLAKKGWPVELDS